MVYGGLIIGLTFSLFFLVHSSVNLGLYIYAVPLFTIAIPIALLITRSLSRKFQIPAVTVSTLVVWSVFPLLRIDGFTGAYLPEIAWRWSPPIEQMLPSESQYSDSKNDIILDSLSDDWPGFRGPSRDSRCKSPLQKLDWEKDPPKELWRIPVGAGWSSFAYVSGRLFTQEQRGDHETVTCYDAETGALIWMHTDSVRFTELVSGAGPRATPTFAEGRIFTMGSKGLLSCLDASSGNPIWQRDLMVEFQAPLPVWGFSSSPLVVDDVVIVYAGGKGDNGLVAFRGDKGDLVWKIPSRGMNFSSAQSVILGGVPAVVFGDSSGLFAVDPAKGKKLWSYQPANWKGPAICQPQQVGPNSLIAPLGDGVGVVRLEFSRDGDQWSIKEKWSTRRLRPSFNDFVYHENI